MLKRAFLTALIVLAGMVPGLSLADDPFMPYMDPEGPAPREIRCRIAEHGTVYHVGACYFQASPDGSFTVVTGNAKYAAMVTLIDGDYAQGLWTGEAYAAHMHGQMHDLQRSTGDRACWENDKFSICAW